MIGSIPARPTDRPTDELIAFHLLKSLTPSLPSPVAPRLVSPHLISPPPPETRATKRRIRKSCVQLKKKPMAITTRTFFFLRNQKKRKKKRPYGIWRHTKRNKTTNEVEPRANLCVLNQFLQLDSVRLIISPQKGDEKMAKGEKKLIRSDVVAAESVRT